MKWFRVPDSGFSRFRVPGSWIRVTGCEHRVQVSMFRIPGSGSGVGFKIQELRLAPLHPSIPACPAPSWPSFPPSAPSRAFGSEGWKPPQPDSNSMVRFSKKIFLSILNFTYIRSSHMLHPSATQRENVQPERDPLNFWATGTSHVPNFGKGVVVLESCLDVIPTTLDSQCYFSCEFFPVWVST